MRVFVTHEPDGTITSIVGVPEGGAPAGTVIKGGQRMTEVDLPDITATDGHAKIMERLGDLVDNHVVDVQSGKAAFAKKGARQKKKP